MFQVGQYVLSAEHPNSVGFIERITPSGELVIEWVTPKSDQLPFGHINRELWASEDFHLLTENL